MRFAVDGKILFKDRAALLSSNSSGKAAGYTVLEGDEAQNVAQKRGTLPRCVTLLRQKQRFIPPAILPPPAKGCCSAGSNSF